MLSEECMKSICLICNETASIVKSGKAKCHNDINHAQFEPNPPQNAKLRPQTEPFEDFILSLQQKNCEIKDISAMDTVRNSVPVSMLKLFSF